MVGVSIEANTDKKHKWTNYLFYAPLDARMNRDQTKYC